MFQTSLGLRRHASEVTQIRSPASSLFQTEQMLAVNPYTPQIDASGSQRPDDLSVLAVLSRNRDLLT